MAISNYICETCDHALVCDISKKKIQIFLDDAKNPLGVDIKIEKCINYKQAE